MCQPDDARAKEMIHGNTVQWFYMKACRGGGRAGIKDAGVYVFGSTADCAYSMCVQIDSHLVDKGSRVPLSVSNDPTSQLNHSQDIIPHLRSDSKAQLKVCIRQQTP